MREPLRRGAQVRLRYDPMAAFHCNASVPAAVGVLLSHFSSIGYNCNDSDRNTEGENILLEWAEDASAIWQYLTLFLLAAAPWLDVSLVVPLGILWGLPPVGVSVAAFVGNFLTILALGLFFKQISEWRRRRRERKGITGPTKKETRTRQIWEKYGIPGLAIVAPILVGTDIAAIVALSFGSSKFRVVGWMTVSLALWTVVFAVGSVYGFSFLNFI